MRSDDDILIRAVRQEDATAVARLSGQLGYPVDDGVVGQRLFHLIGNRAATTIVALCRGRVVGWLEVHLITTLESGSRAEIVGLIVDDQHRGRGVGTKLVAAAHQWAQAQGQHTLRVRTNIKRKDAQLFYHSMGFQETKQQRVLELVLEQPPHPQQPQAT